MLWRTGISLDPYITLFERIAVEWPTSPVLPQEAFLLRSPVGSALYQLLPYRGVRAFALLHAVAIVLSYALLAAWFWRDLPGARRAIAFSILLLSPLTAVLIVWVGMYDAFTMLAWAAVLHTLRSRWPLQVAAGFALGLQHAEQGLIGLLLVFLLRPLLPTLSAASRPVAAFVGCVLGKLCLDAYLAAAGASSDSRGTWLSQSELFEPTLRSGVQLFPVILWSGLGALWLFLPLLPRPNWSPLLIARASSALVLWLTVAVVSADHTRVLVMTSVPVLSAGIADVVRHRWPDISSLLRVPQWWLLVLSPSIIVWIEAVLPMGWRGFPG